MDARAIPRFGRLSRSRAVWGGRGYEKNRVFEMIAGETYMPPAKRDGCIRPLRI